MNIYKEMYYRLFNTLTDAIEAIEQMDFHRGVTMLRQAQAAAEDMYLDFDESPASSSPEPGSPGE